MVDRNATAEVADDSRTPPLIYNYSAKATYQPRVEARDFGSIEVRRKLFTPPTPGYGPRTIPRGATHTPTGATVPAGAARNIGRKMPPMGGL